MAGWVGQAQWGHPGGNAACLDANSQFGLQVAQAQEGHPWGTLTCMVTQAEWGLQGVS